jgi:hypothetical protein
VHPGCALTLDPTSCAVLRYLVRGNVVQQLLAMPKARFARGPQHHLLQMALMAILLLLSGASW